MFFGCLSRLRPLGAVRSVPKHGTELMQIFLNKMEQPVAAPWPCGCAFGCVLGVNHVLNGFEAGNGHEMRVYM